MQRKGVQRVGTLLSLLVLMSMVVSVAGTAAAPDRLPSAPVDYNVTTPREFFGYDIGQDYKLTPWQSRVVQGEGPRQGIVEYAQELAKTSNRVHFIQYGQSEQGRPMILSVITSPANWAQIDNLKGILRKLADPRQVLSDDEARSLASQGKAVYWITAGIHASERTSPEVLMRLAYHLASSNDPATAAILDNLIVVLDHSVNPDGLDMVTDWYYKYKGTPYESSAPPYYNTYINHDNNRDYLGLGAVESQQNAAVRTAWHPTVFHDLHEAKQMLYITPGPDPSNEAISGITMAEWLGFAGHTMSGLFAEGYKGIFTYNYANMWYPGFMNSFTSEYNSYAMFYELQGATYASPKNMTQAGEGRSWYNPAPYTVPFMWTLMNAVNLEEDALNLSLDYAVKNKNELLYDFYMKGKQSLQKASTEPPYAFVIPANGGDNADVTDMINNLHAHLFDIDRAAVPFVVNGRQFEAGDYVIPTNQPYGLLLKNLLGVQVYPPNVSSFDVTAWTYGMLRDVETVPVTTTVLASLSMIPLTTTVPYAGSLDGALSNHYVIEHQSNNNLAKALPILWKSPDMVVSQADSAFTASGHSYPAGTFTVKTQGTQAGHATLGSLAHQYGLTIHAVPDALSGVQLRQPKVGLYTPNSNINNTMPEGWVRMLMDRDSFPYTRLYPSDVLSGTLAGYDAIVIPDVSTSALIKGTSSSNLPPEYRLGIGDTGVAKLKSFVENGGTLVVMGRASAMPIQQGWNVGVSLPAAMQTALAAAAAKPEVSPEDLDFPPTAQPVAGTMSCPGTIIKMKVDATTKVGYGYGVDQPVWCDSSTTYYTPADGSQAKVVASYPNEPLLLSGYVTGDDLARGKAAIVDAPLGAGHVVLLGPNVLYRAQATGTYMLYWNSLIEAGRLVHLGYLPLILNASAGGAK